MLTTFRFLCTIRLPGRINGDHRMKARRNEARCGSRRRRLPVSLARFGGSGSRVRLQGWRLSACALLWLAVLGPAAVSAAGTPQPSNGPSPLAIDWHYHADDGQGSFTLFRGADLDALLPVVEVPVRAGTHKYRFFDSAESHRSWFFQLRYRYPDGREEAVAVTYYEGKPEVEPGSNSAVGGSGQRALANSSASFAAPLSSSACLVDGEATATSACFDPPTPPPRTC